MRQLACVGRVCSAIYISSICFASYEPLYFAQVSISVNDSKYLFFSFLFMEYFIKPFSLFSGPKTHTYYIIISLFPMQAMAIIEAQVAHIQSVRLLISVRAYQPANSIFLSQQTSISRTYQSRNQPANRPIDAKQSQLINSKS